MRTRIMLVWSSELPLESLSTASRIRYRAEYIPFSLLVTGSTCNSPWK